MYFNRNTSGHVSQFFKMHEELLNFKSLTKGWLYLQCRERICLVWLQYINIITFFKDYYYYLFINFAFNCFFFLRDPWRPSRKEVPTLTSRRNFTRLRKLLLSTHFSIQALGLAQDWATDPSVRVEVLLNSQKAPPPVPPPRPVKRQLFTYWTVSLFSLILDTVDGLGGICPGLWMTNRLVSRVRLPKF